MYFWGLTIETVTSIVLILSIGLAVDYSAHIGHMFMTVKGDKNARTKETIGEMGPPVFYGGFSTFMAFILLASSNSYVFQTFFKVNFLVVLYGLFHGLVFLPVILSWLGPDPYPTADRVYRHHHPHHTQPIDGESEKKKGEGGLDNPTFTDSNIPPSSTKYSSGSSVSPTLKNSAPHQQRPVSHSQSASVGLQSFPANEPIVSPPPEYSSPTEKLGGLPSVHT